MENNNYDVVIVGTGIAGSIVAKLLTNAGKKVLMLEAGLKAGMALDQQGAFETYQGYLNTFYTNPIKVPNAPYPDIPDAPSSNVLQVQQIKPGPPVTTGYFVQMGPIPFASDNTRAPGGTTLHWLGTTLRMLPNDFKMKSKYGVGVDWPIAYEEMNRYYEMAENEIGVSGDVKDQKYPIGSQTVFRKDYVLPMKKIPTSYMDGVMKPLIEKTKIVLNKKTYDLSTISTPQGRNSIPNPDYRITGVEWNPATKQLELTRTDEANTYEPVGSTWDPYTGQRCEGNASCVPICPVQAKYNAMKTLRKSDMANLEIRTQSVASKLLINETSNWIDGVEYKVYEKPDSPHYETRIAKGTIYVMAASAIENAKLLLASKAANSSDQVGRNLMDHMTVLRWGLTDEPLYTYRGPGSTSNIPTFRDGDFRKDHAAWILPLDNWGWAWPKGTPGSEVVDKVSNQLMFGRKLRESIQYSTTRQFFTHFECEQAPDPDNRVTIDPQYVDNIGNYRPVIHYKATEYMLKAFEATGIVAKQLFDQCKIKDFTVYNPTDADFVTYKGKGYSFAGAGHIVGTHRMGFTPEDSVVNADMRTWDHENLFLVGCGNMPTLGTSNPTLTMSALTFKAAEAILKQLEQ